MALITQILFAPAMKNNQRKVQHIMQEVFGFLDAFHNSNNLAFGIFS